MIQGEAIAQPTRGKVEIPIDRRSTKGDTPIDRKKHLFIKLSPAASHEGRVNHEN